MNKIKISLLAIAAVLVLSLNARAEFGYGIKAGLNVDKMHVSKSLYDTDNRCGFTVGATAEYIAPIIGVGVDASLMFTRMFAEMGNGKAHGSFLEIPVHAKYKFNIPAVNSIVRPYVFTGPSVAVKLGGSESFFHTKSTQWGWDLGLGVQLIKHLQIGAGYTFGLNNIAPKGYTASSNIKLRNNYWTVTAAWMF